MRSLIEYFHIDLNMFEQIVATAHILKVFGYEIGGLR